MYDHRREVYMLQHAISLDTDIFADNSINDIWLLVSFVEYVSSNYTSATKPRSED